MSLKLFVCLAILMFTIFVYPRPFKNPNLSYLLPEEVSRDDLEFGHSGLFSGCEVELYFTDLAGTHSGYPSEPAMRFPISVSRIFSPWLNRIDNVLYEQSYFDGLKFEECYSAIEEAYSDLLMADILVGGRSDTLIMIGGITPYSTPLSHANSLIILPWRFDNTHFI